MENTMGLLQEGSSIPFISRYRKEATGGLDEVQVTEIRDNLEKLREIDSRRAFILSEIEKQNSLTDELRKDIETAGTLTELEDLYLPYKAKKKTRAEAAREKGLLELAEIIFSQVETGLQKAAERFIGQEVPSIQDALQGARDIIAEWINEDREARESIRSLFREQAVIRSTVHKDLENEAVRYRDYFNYEEILEKCPSHRLLAMRRGEKEGYLKVSITVDEEKATKILKNLFVRDPGPKGPTEQMALAAEDSYRRLLQPSIENEFARQSKIKADREAIKVFTSNLRQLLMAPILGSKRVMALDPGFRTGCKVVILDEQGDLMDSDTIYPNPPRSDTEDSGNKLVSMVRKYNIDAIALGNGTASRETREFLDNVDFGSRIPLYVVSESGASIYSASKAAREEFPDEDVTVRGSVSIGRRLMDPMAELVKIDPRNLGVGQYQHDVDQGELKKSLDRVVESCVNLVGVNLNTASRHLLTYVSGLGPAMAANIVAYRTENGPFDNRRELLKVPRLGKKAYEQCGGFLRICGGSNPLDNSSVHPESYYVVEKMAKDLGMDIPSLLSDQELEKKIDLHDYVDQKTGLPTIGDIIHELARPGRDPRKTISAFDFRKSIRSIEDLQTGMILPGIVTNITNFGAFVDIGIKQDGLVHISNLSHDYVKDPGNVVTLHQEVKVKVLDIDTGRGRVQLSIKDAG